MLFYNLSTFLLKLFAPVVSLILPKKLQLSLELRSAIDWQHTPRTGGIWFHVSSGEFEHIRYLLTALRKAHPKTPLYVSYFSPSYEKAVLKHPAIDWAFPLPWDTPANAKKLFEKLQPKALCVVRTDLWPNILRTARAFNVPTRLLAISQSTIAKKGQRLEWIDEIWSIDGKAGEVDIPQKVFGDPRVDAALERAQNPRLTLQMPEPHFVFASTWPEDDRCLFAALSSIKAPIIWVPHEPHESQLQPIETALAGANKKHVRLSNILSEERISNYEWDVLVVDKIGFLADLYRGAQGAFVGGSFKAKVHSILEPLALGAEVIVGPYHHNTWEPEAFRQVHSVSNETELKTAFENWSPQAPNEVLRNVEKHAGATQKILAELESMGVT